MDAKYLNPFLEALKNVLEMFGTDGTVKVKNLLLKDRMTTNHEISSFLGLVGDLRGNISYSYSNETARKIVELMMGSCGAEEFGEMEVSVFSEFANMVTGNATGGLAQNEINSDITTPTTVVGGNMAFLLSTVKTVSVIVDTSVGPIEVNFGLEI